MSPQLCSGWWKGLPPQLCSGWWVVAGGLVFCFLSRSDGCWGVLEFPTISAAQFGPLLQSRFCRRSCIGLLGPWQSID